MKKKQNPLDDALYPPVEPHASGYIKVSPIHRIYYEESGNPKGKPVIFLHGGPGGGTEPSMRRFFNPRKYRIVLFDQRGCGKSKPHGSLEDNTTWHLVDDIEVLRRHLKIDKWQVFGGSWGSTLALAYAQAHPKRVTEMVLRGIFLLRDWELAWFYTSDRGTAALFPDAHEKLVAHIPPAERKDLVKAYYKRLTSKNRATMIEAARIWSVWEGTTSYLMADQGKLARFKQSAFAAAFARIECHYFINGGFLKSETQLLDEVKRIRKIPCIIVQGRYDVVCPMRSAWDLHKAWPEATLNIVPDAGHSAFEVGNARALVAATDTFAAR